MTIRPAATSEGDHLVAIWLRSVRATHAFLTEDDIQELLPFVRAELNDPVGLDLWVLLDDHDVSVGFAGLAGAEVAALFLDPRTAVGRRERTKSRGRPFLRGDGVRDRGAVPG
jgi:putative acetyltransferase